MKYWYAPNGKTNKARKAIHPDRDCPRLKGAKNEPKEATPYMLKHCRVCGECGE